MTRENIRALVQYRLEQADESLQAASLLIENNLSRQAVNRSYYAMYYAVTRPCPAAMLRECWTTPGFSSAELIICLKTSQIPPYKTS
jgi:hypothetical protein